jgi:hypothetical protein
MRVFLSGFIAMDDELILATRIDENRSLFISSVSRKTYLDTDAQVFGSDRGFFVIEQDDSPGGGGFSILAKVASLEAAYRLSELFEALRAPIALPQRG